jgi:hypothetical protein
MVGERCVGFLRLWLGGRGWWLMVVAERRTNPGAARGAGDEEGTIR